MCQVYTINFSDGSVYVGSATDYRKRYRDHCKYPCNKLLDHKMRDPSLTHELKLIGEFETRQAALVVEKAIALNLELPINVYEPTVSGIGRFLPNSDRLKRDHIPELSQQRLHYLGRKYQNQERIADSEIVRCSRCQRRKPASEYETDRSRFNGLYSQCKQCHDQVRRERRLEALRRKLCTICMTPCPDEYPPHPTHAVRCRACKDKHAADKKSLYHRRRAAGVCTTCGDPNLAVDKAGRRRQKCERCRARHLQHQKQHNNAGTHIYHRRRAAGVCITCGDANLAVSKTGRKLTHCESCRQRQREYAKNNRAKNKIVSH